MFSQMSRLKVMFFLIAPNLILTPHIAASTVEAQLVVAEQIAEQISDYFNKGEVKNSV